MKKKTTFAIILVVLLAAVAIIIFVLSRPSIDTMAKKLAKSYPSAVIKYINPYCDVTKPVKSILITIGDDRVLLFEYKDKASADYGVLVYSDASLPEERFTIYSKGKIMVKYTGSNEELSSRLKDLLHVKPVAHS